jgi:hypothetical protein
VDDGRRPRTSYFIEVDVELDDVLIAYVEEFCGARTSSSSAIEQYATRMANTTTLLNIAIVYCEKWHASRFSIIYFITARDEAVSEDATFRYLMFISLQDATFRYLMFISLHFF